MLGNNDKALLRSKLVEVIERRYSKYTFPIGVTLIDCVKGKIKLDIGKYRISRSAVSFNILTNPVSGFDLQMIVTSDFRECSENLAVGRMVNQLEPTAVMITRGAYSYSSLLSTIDILANKLREIELVNSDEAEVTISVSGHTIIVK